VLVDHNEQSGPDRPDPIHDQYHVQQEDQCP